MFRSHTKSITIGNKVIGGGNPILIQSMTNTKTEDVRATAAQILELEKAGAELRLGGLYDYAFAQDDFNTCDSVTKMLAQIGMRSEWTLSGKEAVLRANQALN